MPKRSGKPKKSEDANEAAFRVVSALTDEPAEAAPPKNPHAVALGRRGGLKGGKSRMDSMTPEQRSDLAKMAAAKRWGKRTP